VVTRASQSCACSDIKRSREIAGIDVLYWWLHGNKLESAGAPTSDSASFHGLTHRAPVRHRIPEFPTLPLLNLDGVETWMTLLG